MVRPAPVEPAAEVLIDNIVARPIDQKLTDMVRPWPTRNDYLYLELEDSLFPPGTTVKVNIEVSFDGGLTFRNPQSSLFAGGEIKPDPDFPDRTTKRFIKLGPYKRGTEAKPLEGEIFNPTHVRISVEPARGVPVIGVRTNL